MEAHTDEIGPIDIVVIAYPADAPMTGEAVPIVVDLVERGIIRVLDVLFVMQNEDGMFSGFEASGLDEKGLGDFKEFEGASSGLLGEEDVATASEALEPGSAAVMIVYENRWAAPFVAAVRRNGGVVIDNQRIPVQDVIDALDAVEATAWSKGPPMPGLLRGMARTAVVAGTATAVSNRVSRRQAERWAGQDAYSYPPQGYAEPPPPAPAASPGGGEDRVQQLKDLAALKEQGVLTDAEFAAEKARILGQ